MRWQACVAGKRRFFPIKRTSNRYEKWFFIISRYSINFHPWRKYNLFSILDIWIGLFSAHCNMSSFLKVVTSEMCLDGQVRWLGRWYYRDNSICWFLSWSIQNTLLSCAFANRCATLGSSCPARCYRRMKLLPDCIWRRARTWMAILTSAVNAPGANRVIST